MPNEDVWINRGALAMLGVLILWTLRYGIPTVLEVHRKAIGDLVSAFKTESDDCRSERLALAATMAVERDKDRALRRELIEVIRDGNLNRNVLNIEHETPNPEG